MFISMVKALNHQEKPDDAKRCLEVASDILEKKENVSSLQVSEAYNEVAELDGGYGAVEAGRRRG